MTQAIPAAKLRGLRERLEADGRVVFQGGAAVGWLGCPSCKGTGVAEAVLVNGQAVTHRGNCGRCEGTGKLLQVHRPSAPGSIRVIGPFDETGLRLAYAHALHGWPRKAQPSGDLDRFGEVPF